MYEKSKKPITHCLVRMNLKEQKNKKVKTLEGSNGSKIEYVCKEVGAMQATFYRRGTGINNKIALSSTTESDIKKKKKQLDHIKHIKGNELIFYR